MGATVLDLFMHVHQALYGASMAKPVRPSGPLELGEHTGAFMTNLVLEKD
jgi:hypothetical protein